MNHAAFERDLRRSHVQSWLWLTIHFTATVGAFSGFAWWAFGGTAGLYTAAILSGSLLLLGLFAGLFTQSFTRAHRAGPELHELQHVVTRLAEKAKIKPPALYYIVDDAPNACAFQSLGRTGKVAVTTGLVDALDSEQITGVLAHEVAHLANGDSHAMTLATSTVGFMAFIADSCQALAFSFGIDAKRIRTKDGKEEEVPASFLDVLGMLLGAALMVVAFIFYSFGMLMTYAMSRSREFTADLKAVELTGNPRGLRRALQQLGTSPPSTKSRSSTEHLWIVPPSARRRKRMLNTHPPVSERIAVLKDLESYYR